MTTTSNIGPARSFFRKFVSPLVVIVTAVFLAFFWFRSLAIEPFDFDESVYRQMAEEVKKAGGWLSQPIFNGEPYHHKPPTYIALLAVFSLIADGAHPQVTSFSSRSLSIFFSVALAFLLHKTWSSLRGRGRKLQFEFRKLNDFSISPVFFLLMSFLPTVASSAVLLDPMLIFFTSLFVCCEALRISMPNVSPSKKIALLMGSVIGMSFATATKGLIGLVLPAGAAVIYSSLIHLKDLKTDRKVFLGLVFRTGVVHFLPVWFAAFVVSVFYYYFIWGSGGSAFVEEFFIRHHFGRATSAMEGHSGSLFYYLPIIVVGGGFTLSWLAYAVLTSAKNQRRSEFEDTVSQQPDLSKAELWLMSWCVFCLLFFSFLATKLPNYIWPIWPALALWCGLAFRGRSWQLSRFLSKVLLFLARWIPFLFPMILLAGGFLILSWRFVFSDWITLKPRESAVLEAALEHASSLSIGFLSAGCLLFAGGIVIRWWGEVTLKRGRESLIFSHGVARWVALSQVSACAVLMMFAIPAAEDVMTLSVQRSTSKAKMFLGVGETLATSDLYSPNVVSSHGAPVHFSFGDNEWVFNQSRFNVILTPVWNVGLCQRHGYDIAQGSDFLRVCLRAYKRTLEGPSH